ncbi:hypothetical protein CROQUDRAFT_516945 [Cronartium quercuum f. sp. fusiforme G11]|uniref:Uncharacterized protein n=1 Tax=Cronartium quercuum f. sp. fusiforme G11 TaxID=708437 RepID=A0A9P6NI94_9BASI|nr:hypothetical protein CROQUDRAFT_516945 [Cronartium quercuum f. sp. fusiforme G11]
MSLLRNFFFFFFSFPRGIIRTRLGPTWNCQINSQPSPPPFLAPHIHIPSPHLTSMSPNRNASTSKTLNQARNLTHPYLQARDSISATNRTKVIRNEDKDHLDPRCLSSAKLTFMVYIEVHLPNGEDEDDDEAAVQKNSKKTPKASKEASGNYTTYKNDHPCS